MRLVKEVDSNHNVNNAIGLPNLIIYIKLNQRLSAYDSNDINTLTCFPVSSSTICHWPSWLTLTPGLGSRLFPYMDSLSATCSRPISPLKGGPKSQTQKLSVHFQNLNKNRYRQTANFISFLHLRNDAVLRGWVAAECHSRRQAQHRNQNLLQNVRSRTDQGPPDHRFGGNSRLMGPTDSGADRVPYAQR